MSNSTVYSSSLNFVLFKIKPENSTHKWDSSVGAGHFLGAMSGGFSNKLQEWENFYNYERPHGALGGISPYERLRDRAGLEG
jgi:hypothetical protein